MNFKELKQGDKIFILEESPNTGMPIYTEATVVEVGQVVIDKAVQIVPIKLQGVVGNYTVNFPANQANHEIGATGYSTNKEEIRVAVIKLIQAIENTLKGIPILEKRIEEYRAIELSLRTGIKVDESFGLESKIKEQFDSYLPTLVENISAKIGEALPQAINAQISNTLPQAIEFYFNKPQQVEQ